MSISYNFSFTDLHCNLLLHGSSSFSVADSTHISQTHRWRSTWAEKHVWLRADQHQAAPSRRPVMSAPVDIWTMTKLCHSRGHISGPALKNKSRPTWQILNSTAVLKGAWVTSDKHSGQFIYRRPENCWTNYVPSNGSPLSITSLTSPFSTGAWDFMTSFFYLVTQKSNLTKCLKKVWPRLYCFECE